MIAASAALAVSGVPFHGPIGAARVGYINDQYVLCPTESQLKESKLDLVVAGTERAVLMVESEAQQLSEEVMLGAVMFGHEQMQAVIEAIDALVEEGGKPLWDWEPAPKNEALLAKITEIVGDRINDAFTHRNKQERNECLRVVYEDVQEKIAAAIEAGELEEVDPNEVNNILFEMEARHVRGRSLPEKDVSTAVIHALFAQSKSVQVFSRELMVPLCLHAAKLRLWLLLLSVQSRMNRLLILSAANIANAS